MTFVLGKRSLLSLKGVHPTLVAVVERAIKITKQDFTVIEGCRTLEKQKEYVASGASQTMNSNHLVKADGKGYAVDLAPYIAGSVRWEMKPICVICHAMALAAQEEKVPIRWGGFWALISPTSPYDISTPDKIFAASHEYAATRKARGQSAFIDGPHFEFRPDLVK